MLHKKQHGRLQNPSTRLHQTSKPLEHCLGRGAAESRVLSKDGWKRAPRSGLSSAKLDVQTYRTQHYSGELGQTFIRCRELHPLVKKHKETRPQLNRQFQGRSTISLLLPCLGPSGGSRCRPVWQVVQTFGAGRCLCWSLLIRSRWFHQLSGSYIAPTAGRLPPARNQVPVGHGGGVELQRGQIGDHRGLQVGLQEISD